ncbi:3688_t:CDS:1 [Acaulospora morrowiae]|uniref:3688_t:CDS:1 n=1 Tax=Acaulospora morrowiae TaxID=94023 RepID=A0A9N8YZD8_9GLOM|nr:3688_t:CDS:1 [Acaulospora morrowiae]
MLPTDTISSSSSTTSSSQPICKYFTRATIIEENDRLMIENESLRKENEILKNEKKGYDLIQEELEALKNPGTCSLRLALKYSAPRQTNNSEPSQLQKRRKTLPFNRLLTNDDSLHELKLIDELAKNKAEAIKQKKKETLQKRANCEKEKAQKKVESM